MAFSSRGLLWAKSEILIKELLLCDLYRDTNPMWVAAVDAENKLNIQQGIQ